MTRKINASVELTYDEIRALPAFTFQRSASDEAISNELERIGWTMTLPGPADSYAGLRSLGDQAGRDLRPGDDVAVYSRGSVRLGRIVKVGRTKLHVAYVTPGGVDEAEKIAAWQASRTEAGIRERAEGTFSAAAGWENGSARDAKIEEVVAREVEKTAIAKAEGWAAIVNVTVYQARPSEIKAIKTIMLGDEDLPAKGPDQDQAVAYFVETVERRLDAGVVDVGQYLEGMRIELSNAAAAIAADELLQDDQKAEKLARVEAKRAELLRIQTERLGRQVVSVGWDGASRPMLRYRDELHLNDSARTTVTSVTRRDATEVELMDEPDAVLEALAAGGLEATEATQELAKAVLEGRRAFGSTTGKTEV